MKQLNFFTLFLLFGSLLISCSVDDLERSEEEEILKSERWRRYSHIVNGEEKLLDCMKDDIYEFFDDGTARVTRFNTDHRLLDTIIYTGTHQEFINEYINPTLDNLLEINEQEEYGVTEIQAHIFDTTHVENGVRYIVQKPIELCGSFIQGINGSDTPILRWYYDGNQKSLTYFHDVSFLSSIDIPETPEILLAYFSNEKNIINIDYKLTFIQSKEFHLKLRSITTNDDGTQDERFVIIKYQAEPNIDPKFSFKP